MNQPSTQKTSGGATVAILGLSTAILLPAIYLLAIGPIVAMYPNRAPRWIELIYAPLVWLAQHSEVFRETLHWYVELFTN